MVEFLRRNVWRILWGAVKEWHEDKVPRLAAALAFYTVFALTPIVLTSLAIAGLFQFERAAALDRIKEQVEILAGEDASRLLDLLLLAPPKGSLLATVVGLTAMLYAALATFVELKDALDTIWQVQPKAGLRLWPMLRSHLLSFAMMVVVGFFLLVSLIISAITSAASSSLRIYISGAVLVGLETAVSFLVIWLIFALIYKVLPDVRVPWRDVWFGAAVAAVLFAVGKMLFGLYLGHSTIGTTYGAAGSLVIVVLWTYYSALILLFGAEITQVQAQLRGDKAEPTDEAIPLTDHDRIQQGIPRDDQVEESREEQERQEQRERREEQERK